MNCQACGIRPATQRHHRFSQTKWAKRIYGDLIHHPKNIMRCCADCHSSHASPKLEHWDEARFCHELGIPPRSKVSQRVAPVS